MTPPTVLFLPGNGHDSVRLEGVRAVLSRDGNPFQLLEVTYPKVGRYDQLLDAIESQGAEWHAAQPRAPIYATGIGGLVALSLRARGVFTEHPLLIQGAVLWGLEQRWFPRVMRLPRMPHLLAWAFTRKRVRRRFSAHHFLHEPAPDWSERFFAGYGDADAFANWFRWLTPALLRDLERRLAKRPEALENLVAWWGEADSVVGPEELRITERALGVTIPLRTFESWGHYPMIDDPQAWVRAVAEEVNDVVETSSSLP